MPYFRRFVLLLAALATGVPMFAQPAAQTPPTAAPASASAPAAPVAKTAAPAAAAANTPDAEEPDPWPKVLEGKKYRFEVYPPQVESWEGDTLQAMNAIAVSEKGAKAGEAETSKFYGSVLFSARTRVDKEARMVTVDRLHVDRIRFPSAPEQEANFSAFLQERFGSKVRTVALDRLEAAVAGAERRAKQESKPVKNDAPAVLLSEKPALLVYVDGTPAWRKVEGTSYERLINTRPLVLRDALGTHFLHLFDGWLIATELAGPWRVAPAKPAGIDSAMKNAVAKQQADLLEGGGDAKSEVDADDKPIAKPTLAKGPVPDILVATGPTELVVFDGAPKWVAIPQTKLEFVENTTGSVFRLGGAKHYVLLSGRWFEAATLAGPWSYVAQKDLAADFKAIPDESPKENVKASIAGTPQSEEAAIANSIPETAEVKRKTATFKPTYDGEPKWKAIEGTALSYAENSPSPVVRVAADQYYAVQNGVWFLAPQAQGPWIVAVRVPPEIYSIPPSSPIHYVTYVRIYDANDDVVTVGYTPGYYGSVVSENVVVYGTGYVYTPWVGSYWWGPPVTWGYGCGMTYTPWGGWSYAFGIGWGWGYWGGWYAPYPAPWWGPYHGWYGGAVVGAGGGWAAWGPGGWAGTTGNVYRQWGSVSSVSRYSGGYNAWTGNAWRGQVGAAYNSRTGTIAAGQRGAVANVYTGEYAYGGRGAAHNTRTGTTVAGGRVTMGDADTGREVTAGRVGAYNPRTGEGGSAAWARGDQGGVARVGDDFYAAKDGEVYRRNGQGDWSQAGGGGQWKGVSDNAKTRDLSRQSSARQMGNQRYQGNRMASPSFGGSRGGMRGGGGRRR